jgi:hypothetical protein
MSKNYRTAQGRIIDMASLAAKNERTRAVGINQQVNARGDDIDPMGKIIKPVTQKVGKKYQETVGNRSAQVKSKPAAKTAKAAEELSLEELELQNLYDEEDKDIEKVKGKEEKK